MKRIKLYMVVGTEGETDGPFDDLEYAHKKAEKMALITRWDVLVLECKILGTWRPTIGHTGWIDHKGGA